ncbi:MAG TPA: hypothetical protein VK733_09520 [Gemmatimonadaceae bacterium]|jgi:hypothetical protein|nr:hypothetical protein [Gemmatimonadaceae bacterium]
MTVGRAACLTWLISLLAATQVSAQSTQAATEQAKTASDQSTTYAIPEIPAASFLGVTPATIGRPSAPKDVLTSLLNGVDANGRVQQGLAIEGSPYIIPGVTITPDEYSTKPLMYLLANTRLSFATARASGDTSSTSAALGLRMQIFDFGDAMMDKKYRQRLATAIGACKPTTFPVDSAALAKSLACIHKVDSTYVRDNWNSLRLSIAGAHGITFDSSYIKRERNLGDQLWLTFGAPVTKFGEIVAYVQLAETDKHGTTPYYSSWSEGGRAMVGSPSFDAFFEEVLQQRSTSTATIARRAQSWSAGVEFLVASNLWLSGGFGKPATQGPTPQKTVLLANVKWGLADKARFKPQTGGP